MSTQVQHPRCREEQIAAGLPYPKSTCELCGSLLRPDWRCEKQALAALRASHAELLEVMRALISGCEYTTFDARPPRWHIIAPPSTGALEAARHAIGRAEALAGGDDEHKG